ncbi:hypothetical protein Tco_0039451 [Tanacetum coccineum]
MMKGGGGLVKMLMYIFIDFKSLKGFNLHAVKRIFRWTMLGTTMTEDQLQEVVNTLGRRTSFLAIAETNNGGLSPSTEGRIWLEPVKLCVSNPFELNLLFDDENGVDCFLRSSFGHAQRYWYEGPKSTSWEQFGPNIALLLFGQLFLKQALEGVTDLRFSTISFLPLNVFTSWGSIREEEQSTSPHSRATVMQGMLRATPTKSYLLNLSTASVTRYCFLSRYCTSQGTVKIQRTADLSSSKPKLQECPILVAPCRSNITALWVEESKPLKQAKERRKKHKKQVSSVKLGRNQDEGTLLKEQFQEEDTTTSYL